MALSCELAWRACSITKSVSDRALSFVLDIETLLGKLLNFWDVSIELAGTETIVFIFLGVLHYYCLQIVNN